MIDNNPQLKGRMTLSIAHVVSERMSAAGSAVTPGETVAFEVKGCVQAGGKTNRSSRA